MVGHHLQYVRKSDEGDKRGIISLLLRGIGKRSSGEARILRQPVRNVEDLLRIRRSRCDLGQQRIRIERDWRQQLVELLRVRGRRSSSLRPQNRSNPRQQKKDDEKKRYQRHTGSALHPKPPSRSRLDLNTQSFRQ
jgi:hypothetical protein